MNIFAIETSCDETGLAFVKAGGGLSAPKFKVLKETLASQIETHRPWGGVVPGLAKREHEKNLPVLFEKILKNETYSPAGGLKPDVIAVTVGPGLEPCLWSGINFAEEIHKKHFPKAKLVGINHLEGHLYSFLLDPKTHPPAGGLKPNISELFPAVALLVSGGHTMLIVMESMTKWKKLGETRDDAAGEAFDKAARMLNLPYPGGPEIEKLAKNGYSDAVEFPRPMMYTKDYDFSFSGLKTAVLYYLRDQADEANQTNKADVAASFQKAAFEPLVTKTKRAVREFGAQSIFLSGGVAANKELQAQLKAVSRELKTDFYTAPVKYNTDNGVMIAVAAYITIEKRGMLDITAQANLGL